MTLLSREGCGLCEEFAAELATLATQISLPPLEIADVDSDPEWQRRYGLKIPVLLWGGEAVLTTIFDATELHRLFRVR
ncbi:MAG: hypothetical protein RLZZ33_449 [Pseudomonadota bacterium]